MILDVASTNGRVAAAAGDPARHSVAGAKTAASSYADVMDQVAREPAPPPVPPAREVPYWQDREFAFGDVLDVINPLHHIPIVATIYRNLTNDKIGFVPRLVGGTLWGRIGGLVAGVVNSVVEWFTGKDVGDHIFAALWGERQPASPTEAARAEVDAVKDNREMALTQPVAEAERAAVAPVAAHADRADVPALPAVSPPGAVSIRQLPGINHWHDPTEIDAPVTGARIRLRA